jgi:hypothetical protein
MNKKVLRTMITLVVVFLVALYVLKIFFPEQFVMAIQNEQFVKIGNFIDSKEWLSYICSGITMFVGTYFYLCATTRKWYLSIKEISLLLGFVIATQLLYLYDANLANGISIMMMIILPCILKSDLKTTTTAFCIHYTSQLLSLKIRDLPLLLTNINSIISIFLTFECYLWLLLLYLYFNYKKEKD